MTQLAPARIRAMVVAATSVLFAASAAACQTPRDTVDVLFVGNSYVYFNDLPAMVQEISTALDGPVLRGVPHTRGGQTLRGHLDDGHVSDILSTGPADGGGWDWVVLQEQSTLGAPYDQDTGELGSPEAFGGAARELAAMIRAAGAEPALYMTWAKEAFPEQAETLSRAYRSIGTELGAKVAPVGDAWAAVRGARPDFILHVSDGSHPNAAGSYLAACVIYATLTGRSPMGAPPQVHGAPWDSSGIVESKAPTVLVSLSAADASFLQAIAWSTVRAYSGVGR